MTAEPVATLRERPLSPEEDRHDSLDHPDQPLVLDRWREAIEQRQHRLRLMEEEMHRARQGLDGLRTETNAVLRQGEALLETLTLS